ncbi:hypothetical protein PMIN06_012843 [Paraphaeosphaeria minitans]
MLFVEHRVAFNEIRPFERLWIAAISTTGIKRAAPYRLESEPKRRRMSVRANDSACADEMEEVESDQQQASGAEEDAMQRGQSP